MEMTTEMPVADRAWLESRSRDADGDVMILNFGPQHPASHGVLRVKLYLDGEKVVKAVPYLGYLHRGAEKLLEKLTYVQGTPIVDKHDYVSPMTNEQALVMAFEKLLAIEVPRRARYVRTIFDAGNSPPEAGLVLGEVVTFPGGWSSYPPHHHPQPEIYHYRFTAPQGYGHAELGEAVVKVREFDTVCIPAGHDHAQCAAPGYGMYYSWVIRHLPGAPYTAPSFTPEHAWTMSRDARFWWPAEGGHD